MLPRWTHLRPSARVWGYTGHDTDATCMGAAAGVLGIVEQRPLLIAASFSANVVDAGQVISRRQTSAAWRQVGTKRSHLDRSGHAGELYNSSWMWRSWTESSASAATTSQNFVSYFRPRDGVC